MDVSSRLDAALSTEMNEDFDRAISSIGDDNAVGIARDLKAKLTSLTRACSPLVDAVISLVEDGRRGLSVFAWGDADKAELRADDLYSWVCTYLPGPGRKAQDKCAKLEMMPLIVSMAYAVRVKLDAHWVRSQFLPKSKRAQYLKRAVVIVETFVGVLSQALSSVTAGTSLLDIALDYDVPIATYAVLITTLRSSAQEMLTGRTVPTEIARWDDGLSGIR